MQYEFPPVNKTHSQTSSLFLLDLPDVQLHSENKGMPGNGGWLFDTESDKGVYSVFVGSSSAFGRMLINQATV